MLKCLYEKFNNWDKYSVIWLYSDSHFVSVDGLYNDADEVSMRKLFTYADNETQINNINAKVHKDDLLVHLGDVGDPRAFEKLKCKNIVLITGNHDKGNSIYSSYCMEVYNGPLFISDKLLLSHEPLHDDLNRWFNFHGHLHNFSQIDNKPLHENYYCCSANLNNYQPVSLSDFIKHKGIFFDSKGLKNITSLHRQTIDKATERKIRKKELGEFATI